MLKLLLAASTAGTNDARTWEHDLTALRTAGFAGLYRSGVQYQSPAGPVSRRQAFIHPPAVLHGLRILGVLQDLTGWPLRFWLRAGCAVADAGTLALLWTMFGSRVPLLIVALSPVSILISGFHGNTDPIMLFFLVAAVFLVERKNAERGNAGPAGTASGVAFGLACSVKLIPLIFAPAILLYLPGLRPRVKWLAASFVVWIALSLPYLAQEPALIFRSMFGYGSVTGIWGFSLVSNFFGAGRVYNPAAKWIALMAASCLPLLMRRRLFAQCGLIASSFLFLSPGFGLQYLAWAVPWTPILRRRSIIAYHAIAGAFILTVYVAASQRTAAGIYVDLQNSLHFQVMVLMGIVCWITIAGIIWDTATLWGARSPVLPTKSGDPRRIASAPDC
jgi:hypothetical protein